MTVNQTYRGKANLSTSGQSLLLKYIGQTNPGNLIDIIDYTIPAGKKLIALQIFATCRLECKIVLKVDGDQIASGRTGAGHLNDEYNFQPYQEINENQALKVECIAMSGRPATDIEVYLQARII